MFLKFPTHSGIPLSLKKHSSAIDYMGWLIFKRVEGKHNSMLINNDYALRR